MMASHCLQKKVLNGDASHHYDLFCITTIGQVPPLPSITIHYLIINLGLSHYLKKKTPIFATPSFELVFRLGMRKDPPAPCWSCGPSLDAPGTDLAVQNQRGLIQQSSGISPWILTMFFSSIKMANKKDSSILNTLQISRWTMKKHWIRWENFLQDPIGEIYR